MVFAFMVSTVVMTAVPASAHTLEQAVRAGAGCGWSSGGYTIQDSQTLRTSNGVQLGSIYLMWSSTYQENCVVTLKTGSVHGVSSHVEAHLTGIRSGNFPDTGSYAHYAAAHASLRGECVAYRGSITAPNGDHASSRLVEFGWCG